MTDRELLQMALAALSLAVEPKKGKVYAFEFQPIDCAAMHFKTIEALRARLAQPEPQETISKWIKANTEHRQWYICPKCSYQAPRFRDEWVGLTEEETNSLIQKWAGELVFEVTQALKEKNGN